MALEKLTATQAWRRCRVRALSSASTLGDRQPVIVSFARTPIGRFNGALASVPATRLGAVAVKAAVERAGLDIEKDGAAIDEAFLGNVVSAGIGQAPATQAIIFSGLPNTIPTTTVHKVCASGLKAVMFAADAITLGRANIVVAGGFESMSNIPHYLPGFRTGVKLGDGKVVDGLIHDGLWDAYGDIHMGKCAELCAAEYKLDREAQDAFAAESYRRALSAEALAMASRQIAPVEVQLGGGKKLMVEADEEPPAANLAKMPSLRPAFQKDGTVTAANSSKINDGASALVLMSYGEAKRRGVKPLAAVRGFADAAHAPEWFTTAPAKAVPKAIARAGLQVSDMQVHEINEAFAVVALANMKLLNLDPSSVNIHGGAVALGHPIGASGARVVGQLADLLIARGAKFGTASICNGGGGASALVLESFA